LPKIAKIEVHRERDIVSRSIVRVDDVRCGARERRGFVGAGTDDPDEITQRRLIEIPDEDAARRRDAVPDRVVASPTRPPEGTFGQER